MTTETVSRDQFIEAVTLLGLDPDKTTAFGATPHEAWARVITTRDDPDAVIPYAGATPTKKVWIRVGGVR